MTDDPPPFIISKNGKTTATHAQHNDEAPSDQKPSMPSPPNTVINAITNTSPLIIKSEKQQNHKTPHQVAAFHSKPTPHHNTKPKQGYPSPAYDTHHPVIPHTKKHLFHSRTDLEHSVKRIRKLSFQLPKDDGVKEVPSNLQLSHSKMHSGAPIDKEEAAALRLQIPLMLEQVTATDRTDIRESALTFIFHMLKLCTKTDFAKGVNPGDEVLRIFFACTTFCLITTP